MNMIKRTLAMLLALCMLFGALPMAALADDSIQEAADVPVDISAATVEDEASEPDEVPAADDALLDEAPELDAAAEDAEDSMSADQTAETAPTEDPDALMTADLDDELEVATVELGTKPADGTVTGQPFDTTVSANHRIPGLVYHNGKLIASADARWDYEKDGGGMDLVVSRSSDGNTWSYTYAGYLGDNGNVWNSNSSTLMDPVIISDGSKLYLLSDIFPAGYSISSSSTTNVFSATGTGYTSAGNLMLSADDRSTYGYYLKDGAIYDSATNVAVEGYTVTSWFDLYQNGTYVTNLFFSDSPYQLYPTSYISLQTSTDNGATWSAPTLVNAKPDGIAWMVMGPGSGLALDDGNLAFTTYDGSSIYLIWGSTSNGWNRVSTAAATNESSIIELADGTIRAFVKRSGSNTVAYVDFVKSGSGYTAGSLVDTGVANFSNCMVSSLLYSKTYGGEPVVLVCSPSKSSGGTWAGRFNGKIYAFTLDSSNAMTLLGSYQVNNSFFAYSNMAELSDGTVGLLYEDDCISYAAGSYYGNASHISYTNVDLESALGITFDAASQEPETPEEVTVTDGATGVEITAPGLEEVAVTAMEAAVTEEKVIKTYSITLNGGEYKDAAIVKIPYDTAFDGCNRFEGFVYNQDGTADPFPVTREGDFFICEVPHFSELDIEGYAVEAVDTITSNGQAGTAYVLDTDGTLNTSSTYLIVNSGSNGTAYAIGNNNGTIYAAEVTVQNGTISVDEDSQIAWTFGAANGGTVKNNDRQLYVAHGSVSASTATTTYTYTAVHDENGNYKLYRNYYYSYYYPDYQIATNNWDEDKWTGKSSSSADQVPATVYLYEKTSAAAWTVDAAEQEARILAATVTNGEDYEVDSWNAYQAALTAAQNKLAEVESTPYTSETAAQNALSELKTLVVALENAKSALSKMVEITVNYQADGVTVATEKLSVSENEQSVTLPALVTGDNGKVYAVTDPVLTLEAGTESYNVPVTLTQYGDIADFNNIVGTQSYQGDSNANGADGVVELTGKKITALTVSAGSSFQLGVDVTGADSVEWTVADATKITVSETGMVTGIAAGDTTVTATVTKNGVIESITIPVHVTDSFGTSDDMVTVCYYVEKVSNVYPYYTLYSSAGVNEELVSIQEGQVIFFERPKASAFGMIFLSTPKDGYALTYMAATNTDAQYYPLHTGDYNLKTGDNAYYASGNSGYPYYNIYTYYGGTKATMDAMLNKALSDLKCDGAMSMGRKSGDNYPNLGCSLSFIADPMPQITKTVDGVLPTTRKQADYRKYTAGMVAGVDELVYFKITVTVDRPTVWSDEAKTIGAITYSNAIMRDTVLQGAYLYTKELDQADGDWDGEVAVGNRVQTDDITDELNAAWAADEQTRTIEFYLVYQIKTEDIPKFIIENTADLHLDYQSKYSTGSSARDAAAMASITVVGKTMDNIVIDFGQKVEYTGLTEAELKYVSVGNEVDYTAKYGTVTVEGLGDVKSDGKNSYYESYKVTYTPTEILQEPDAVQLYGTYLDTETGETVRKVINGFLVYPATTVYYEETFLNNTNGWNIADKSYMTQAFEYLGQAEYDTNGTLTGYKEAQQHVYGYDPIYAGSADSKINASGGTEASSTTVGAVATFTFTGTGFAVYANCSVDSGYVAVQVKDANGKSVKLYTVDTKVAAGKTDATSGQKGAEYHLPIVSNLSLDHGTYTVTIRKVANVEVKIDGIRIYNTVEDSSVFTVDLEDNPAFYEMRDYVLNAMAVDTGYTISEASKQVYTAISEDGEAPSAVILDNKNQAVNVEDLLKNGPKNELFLYPGQTLAFNVTTNREIQIGLKAPSSATSYKIKDGDTQYLYTSVDMFYKIADQGGNEHTFTITNTGSDILSVTNLKICDDPNAAMAPLTEEDIRVALLAMGFEDDTPIPETPTEPEIPEETEPEIPEETEPEAPEKPAKPQKPGKPGNNKPGQNKPGKPEQKQANAELKIVLVDYTGKTLATAKLSVKGTRGDIYNFKSEQILASVKARMPAKYAIVDEASVSGVEVAYGSNSTVTVQIGKVATLKITYINIFGRRIGSAVITKVQTSNGRCVISAAEIQEAVPNGRYAVRVSPIRVSYGSSESAVITVF